MSAFATYPSLAGRRVLVTGGASGIGAGIVEHFIAQGSHVGFLDLDEGSAESLLARQPAGAVVQFARVDLRDIPAVRSAIQSLRDRLGGGFEVLVNNAARDDRHSIDEVTPEYWDDRMATNLRHQFFCSQAVKDDMIAAGGGSIINMSSNSFLMAQGGFAAYTSAKSGVIGLTRSLAPYQGQHCLSRLDHHPAPARPVDDAGCRSQTRGRAVHPRPALRGRCRADGVVAGGR
jgi:NAD(P)-dependent dehydrogenase (short-subunit alcohol dehydrogenase family)